MKRSLLIDIVTAAVVLMLALGAYSLWFGAVENRSQEAAALTEQLRLHGEVGGLATLARRALDDLEQDEAVIYRHLVSNDGVVPFLESLERTGEELGASVDVVSVGRDEATGTEILISLSIQGGFDAVLRTLGAIEYQPYDTRVSGLTLNTTGAGVWTAAATMGVGALPEAAPNASATITP